MEGQSTVLIRTRVLAIPTVVAQVLRHPQTVRMTTLVAPQAAVLLAVQPRLPMIQMIQVILLEAVPLEAVPQAAVLQGEDHREVAHQAVVQPVRRTVALVMEPTAPP